MLSEGLPIRPSDICTTRQSLAESRASRQRPAPRWNPIRCWVAAPTPYRGAVSQKKVTSMALCVAVSTAPSLPASAPTVCSASSSSAAESMRGRHCAPKVRSREFGEGADHSDQANELQDAGARGGEGRASKAEPPEAVYAVHEHQVEPEVE